ncbi:MAG: hypothetical protein WAX80_01090, partial [Minisyncoccia bacterium]
PYPTPPPPTPPTVSKSVTVAVVTPLTPTIALFASTSTILFGQSSTLNWFSNNITSCTATGAWSGIKAVSGKQIVSPTTTSTYILNCAGNGGTVEKSVTVTVVPSTYTSPTLTFNASSTSITSGQSSTLTWFSTNTSSCTASGAWSGTKAISGSQIVFPTATSTYTLVCTK